MLAQPMILVAVCAALSIATVAMAQSSSAASPATQPAPLRLVIIGDSTVSNYPQDRPDRGWGQFVEERFREGTVKVTNLASPGRSTKTFIQEGRWQKALDVKPDVVLIQFGHNDSHAKEKPESTDAATDYRDYLRRYVDEARAAGASPVLITPMIRRTFNAEGKIQEPATDGNLLPYVEAMKAIGAEKRVPVIDLYASSKSLAEQLGPDDSAAFANKEGDRTHFNEKGARAMADLVLQELPVANPRLAALLKTR